MSDLTALGIEDAEFSSSTNSPANDEYVLEPEELLIPAVESVTSADFGSKDRLPLFSNNRDCKKRKTRGHSPSSDKNMESAEFDDVRKFKYLRISEPVPASGAVAVMDFPLPQIKHQGTKPPFIRPMAYCTALKHTEKLGEAGAGYLQDLYDNRLALRERIDWECRQLGSRLLLLRELNELDALVCCEGSTCWSCESSLESFSSGSDEDDYEESSQTGDEYEDYSRLTEY